MGQPGSGSPWSLFEDQVVPQKPTRINKPEMQIKDQYGDNRYFATTQPSKFPAKLP